MVDEDRQYCFNVIMLTDNDKQTIREIFREEGDRVEVKIDKVLSIVTRTDQEHFLTQAKVTHLEKRVRTIEHKLNITSPSGSVVFA